MGVDPWVEGGEGIGERALRSFDPRAAKSDKDREHREASLEKFRRQMREVENISFSSPVFPNVGTVPPSSDGYTFHEIDWEDLERLITKFIRGLSYMATQQILPKGYIIRVLRPEVYSRIPPDMLNGTAQVFERGAGFRVYRYPVHDDNFTALFHVYLWGRYEFFGTIWRSELEKSPAAS